MPKLITTPTRIPVPGDKLIQEYIGHVNTSTSEISVARMKSPQGWSEPAQAPAFREITLVLAGLLQVDHASGSIDVRAGQAIITEPGERVRYSTPEAEGAEYVAICLPAFHPDLAHRDDT